MAAAVGTAIVGFSTIGTTVTIQRRATLSVQHRYAVGLTTSIGMFYAVPSTTALVGTAIVGTATIAA